LFVPPRWVVTAEPTGLSVRDLVTAERLRVQGTLAAQVLRGESSPLLETTARFDPVLGRFAHALADEGAPVRFDRAALLRGSGFGLLFVELTARCNEECQHCYAESGPARSEALAADTVAAVLSDARRLGFQTVQFTGGDPLLCSFLPQAVAQAVELGLGVEIYTNGLALHGALWDALRLLGPSFAFSFYSHDPAVHDAITRTPGSQARTTRAIARVLEAGLPCRIGVIGLESNRAALADTVRHLRELGVAPARIGVSFERSVGRGHETDAVALDLDALIGVDTHGQRPDPWAGKALVSADGTVYPCIFSRSLPLGSVLERSLEQVLTHTAGVLVPEDLEARTEAWQDRLSCWECRLRAAVLEGS
jgi:MoaA/NifB/PqqE/SkfB family radical SAM enzyme